jgi:cytochrome P450
MVKLLVNSPLSPSTPRDLYFHEKENAWILSQHRDVLAALRSADLSQTGPPRTKADRGIKKKREELHSEAFNALVNSRMSEWQIEIGRLASVSVESLAGTRPVDLVAQFIRPWCLASAIALTGINPVGSESLADLLSDLFASDAAPHDSALKSRAKRASQALDDLFSWPSGQYGKSMFLGVAQTVPAFLASAWAALLQYPSEWRELRAHPERALAATEELLRYAGPVHSLFRRADKETNIRGTTIVTGDHLILRLASANRDPERFANPDLLDIKRVAAGHLALSSGSHYCPGASITRAMTTIGTQAIVSRYSGTELISPIVWSCGTMLIWPSSVWVAPGSVA